jgi:hypothetical protein
MAHGGSVGPYAIGKLYCGFCGEFRRYGINVATGVSGKLLCLECGIQVRPQGRHWTKVYPDKAKRY